MYFLQWLLQQLIELISTDKIKAAINTEVLQEILYRYTAIDKISLGFELFDTICRTFETIWPITKADLKLARKLQEQYALKTRDAIHAATMTHNQVQLLYSYDKAFDALPKIKRLVPGQT